jgi:Tol biopolymer transport system component
MADSDPRLVQRTATLLASVVLRRLLFLTAPVIILVAGLAAKVDQSAEAGSPGTNGRIVFSRQGGGQRLEIFAMNPDGSDQTNLTNNPALDYAPAGSPDGRRIAFLRCEEICHLFVMNADGSGQRRLTNDPGPDYFATWSPDGRSIAFERGDGDIWVMNADGSNPRNLTNSPSTDERGPDWSPDGRRIAFERNDRDIWLMNADGRGQMNLTNSPSAYDANADWSPDGARIVFESVLIASGNAEVFVMNADGSDQRNLTNSYSLVLDLMPAWSPDGTKIAFSSQDARVAPGRNIVVMNTDGSGRTSLTTGPTFDEGADWLPVPSPQPPPVRCVVPRVIGKKLPAAQARIRSAHCRAGRVRRVHSRRVGRVIAQNPRAGARRPAGSRVNLVVGRR